MQKLLKLQHHSHTARHLPHHHTSYRALALVLVIFAFCIVAIQQTSALTYRITAKISAELASGPAVITSPTNNLSTSAPIIEFKGTCPLATPSLIVLLYRGDDLVGSTTCNLNGTFSMPVSLVVGPNLILPRIVNITEDYGPDGPAVLVNYDPGSITRPTPNDIPPLTTLKVVSDQAFIVYKPEQAASLTFAVSGGQPPYKIRINWGDGSSEDVYDMASADRKTVQHTFHSTDRRTVRIEVTDKDGQVMRLVLAAITLEEQQAALTTKKQSTPVAPTTFEATWAVYGLLVLVAAGLWLKTSFITTAAGPHLAAPRHQPTTRARRGKR